MPDSNNAQQKEVNVEELLRLKRAEKPNEAFWNDFDRELHQRMLQTLVKKDPWYEQLLRGVSGRIAQTAAVGAAAAFIAMMVVRPAFVDATNPASPSSPSSPSDGASQFAQGQESLASGLPVEVAMSDLDGAEADYQIESFSAGSEGTSYTPDYSLDGFEVASYDVDAYTTDTATFAAAGVATGLVY